MGNLSVEEIHAAEARGRARRLESINAMQRPRAGTMADYWDEIPGHVFCLNCNEAIGVQIDGDVTMCTACGQWHCTYTSGNTSRITADMAANIAREPMDPFELLEAMDQAALAMRPEQGRRPRAMW